MTKISTNTRQNCQFLGNYCYLHVRKKNLVSHGERYLEKVKFESFWRFLSKVQCTHGVPDVRKGFSFIMSFWLVQFYCMSVASWPARYVRMWGCGAVSGGHLRGLHVTLDGEHIMVCSLSGVSCNLLAPRFRLRVQPCVASRSAGHDVVWALGGWLTSLNRARVNIPAAFASPLPGGNK